MAETTSPSFLERLRRGVIRCDGSMGYLLTRQGVSRDQNFDFLNIEKPEWVAAVHKRYVDEAAVDLLQTNTFGANRFHLRSFERNHEKFVEIINREGVAIARQASAGTNTLIGGSIGPLTHSAGDALRHRLDDPAAIRDAYEEQIRALGEAAVDVFMIETVHRHIEGIAALEIARELFPQIPVVFQVASTPRGETVDGSDLETLIRAADERGADCVGLNCFLDPAAMFEKVLELQEWTSLPLAAQPNVGKRGLLCQGVFEAERSLRTTVKAFSLRLVEAGVRLIGGCCGIAPDHLALVRDHLGRLDDEALARYDRARRERYERARRVVVGLPEGGGPTRLEADLASADPARRPIFVEIDPPRVGEAPDKYLRSARRYAEAGVRLLTIGDNPGRIPRLERNVFARMVLDAVPNCELVLHMACAEMTLVRFATELESLHHLTRNVLVISGDPPSGEYIRSSAPYDLRSISAIRAFSRRAHGIPAVGDAELEPIRYLVGGALNPRALEPQMRKFWTKTAEAGASFCLTQPVFDLDTLERLYESSERLRERLREERGRDCHFAPGVMTLASLRNARILRDGFGMPISKALLTRLEAMDRKSQRALGRAIAREVMAATRERFPFSGGLYVVPQFHNDKPTIADLRAAGWLPEKP